MDIRITGKSIYLSGKVRDLSPILQELACRYPTVLSLIRGKLH